MDIGCEGVYYSIKEVGEHNITVPASPVFPGDQVTWFSAEPTKEMFVRTIKVQAQGGFLVSAEQKEGKVTQLEITSTVGGTMRLLNPWTGKSDKRVTQPQQKLVFTELMK